MIAATGSVATDAGDKPNPDLRHFVQEHDAPYDSAHDTYGVPAFNQPIETTWATAIYNMDVYWSNRDEDYPCIR